ncbi:hypothetical protein F4810DRAFT_56531 [Camillea tinctor]|nr:hypothetical protein F4810DRAFT_56531 [Camillea tinctor]
MHSNAEEESQNVGQARNNYPLVVNGNNYPKAPSTATSRPAFTSPYDGQAASQSKANDGLSLNDMERAMWLQVNDPLAATNSTHNACSCDSKLSMLAQSKYGQGTGHTVPSGQNIMSAAPPSHARGFVPGYQPTYDQGMWFGPSSRYAAAQPMQTQTQMQMPYGYGYDYGYNYGYNYAAPTAMPMPLIPPAAPVPEPGPAAQTPKPSMSNLQNELTELKGLLSKIQSKLAKQSPSPSPSSSPIRNNSNDNDNITPAPLSHLLARQRAILLKDLHTLLINDLRSRQRSAPPSASQSSGGSGTPVKEKINALEAFAEVLEREIEKREREKDDMRESGKGLGENVEGKDEVS